MRVSSIGIILLTTILCCMPIESQESTETAEYATEFVLIEEEPIAIEEPVLEQFIMPIHDDVVEELPSNRWNIELTDEEIEMLAKIIFLEAHLEPEDGISAAIEVVFNRMISDSFPDTLEEVLSQDNPVQFVTWSFIDKGEPTDKEYDMIYAALNGEKEVLTTEYVYFARGKQNNHDPIKIGDHWFCKE